MKTWIRSARGKTFGADHPGATEKDFQQLGQGGIGDVVNELKIVLGLAGIEEVLLGDADDEFIHQRVSETRDLHEVSAVLIGLIDCCVVPSEAAVAREPRSGPGANDRASAGRNAGDRQLQGNRGDVLIRGVGGFRIGLPHGVQIDEVKHLAEIDLEGLLPGADEHAAGLGTARDFDVVEKLCRIGVVIRN